MATINRASWDLSTMTIEKSGRGQKNADAAFYTIKEYAARVKVSEKSIRRLRKSGELVGHKFGNQWRISAADADTFERLNRISKPRT
jgi:excisionase family DNA binding protein